MLWGANNTNHMNQPTENPQYKSRNPSRSVFLQKLA